MSTMPGGPVQRGTGGMPMPGIPQPPFHRTVPYPPPPGNSHSDIIERENIQLKWKFLECHVTLTFQLNRQYILSHISHTIACANIIY